MATLRSYCANCWKFNDKLTKEGEKCACITYKNDYDIYDIYNTYNTRRDWKGNFYKMEKDCYNPKMRPQFWKQISDFVKYY